ncbi:MAG: tetratricopeptide repeat protein [Treponema sp.]|jgi:tetratricopeptide (TPR) repeat protein|nr:tetratricopeptide repeat protein [Treponema sp.]
MFGFIKKLFGFAAASVKIDPDAIVEEQWTADFTQVKIPDDKNEFKHSAVRFSIDPVEGESRFSTGIRNGALVLWFYKTNCIAWTEDLQFRYRDLVTRARINLAPKEAYTAAGFNIRMVDNSTYYMILVSNRGYFRFDLVRNGMPLALAGWTEIPRTPVKTNIPTGSPEDVFIASLAESLAENGEENSDENGEENSNENNGGDVDTGDQADSNQISPISLNTFDLEIVAFGRHLLLMIDDQWAGEWDDSSLSEGRIAFCAANYEGNPNVKTAEAALCSFSLDSRIDAVEDRYHALKNTGGAQARVRLAETFAAQGQTASALSQLRRAWRIQSAAPEELLLGAKLAMSKELWDEADTYVEKLLLAPVKKTLEQKEARNLKAAILYLRGNYDGLILWSVFADDEYANPSANANLLGHAYFNTARYTEAAAAYSHAFELDGENALAAKNTASAFELSGMREKALEKYREAANLLLKQNNYADLGLIIPKLRFLGNTDWEARAIIGKWAFGIDDFKTAEEELNLAEEIRKKHGGRNPDAAVYYLQALLLIRDKKRRQALPLFEKAVKYEGNYPLFRFRLAECRFLLDDDPDSGDLKADMEIALAVDRESEAESYGWIHNFAAHIALRNGNIEEAQMLMEKAASVLGEVPDLRVNRAVAWYLSGDMEKALRELDAAQSDDPDGIMANCAGNLLVREKRFEEADSFYHRAINTAPGNREFRCNRASCLIELGRYGEADDVLTAGLELGNADESVKLLELIALVAVKKGEYKRAEAAARAALNIDGEHVPSLLYLGWASVFTRNWNEVSAVLDRLDDFELDEETAKSRDDLEAWLEDAFYRKVNCAICGREWLVERDAEPVKSMRLYATPPDDMPAGTCPSCGKTYCVGCRKEALDESGRMTCPDCNVSLKFTDDGLKGIIYEWARKNLRKQRKAAEAAATSAANAEADATTAVVAVETPAGAAEDHAPVIETAGTTATSVNAEADATTAETPATDAADDHALAAETADVAATPANAEMGEAAVETPVATAADGHTAEADTAATPAANAETDATTAETPAGAAEDHAPVAETADTAATSAINAEATVEAAAVKMDATAVETPATGAAEDHAAAAETADAATPAANAEVGEAAVETPAGAAVEADTES